MLLKLDTVGGIRGYQVAILKWLVARKFKIPQSHTGCYGWYFIVQTLNRVFFHHWQLLDCKPQLANFKSQIYPRRRLTWNLQITGLERKMIFQTSMIMLHVNLQGCTTTRNCWNVFLRDYEVAVLMSSLRALSGSDRAACRASLVAQRNREKKKQEDVQQMSPEKEPF